MQPKSFKLLPLQCYVLHRETAGKTERVLYSRDLRSKGGRKSVLLCKPIYSMQLQL